MNSRNVKAVIVTVNYQGADSTLNFVDSLSKLSGFVAVDVVIVENGSPDDSAAHIRAGIGQLANVSLLESPVNRGYFGGANWALQQCLARGSMPDWVIVCNNDIVFEDPQFLVNLFQRDPATVGVLAPAVIARLTSVDANPFLRERPSPWQMRRYKFWLSHFSLMWFKQWLSPQVRILRHRLKKWRPSAAATTRSRIYAPHGCFIIFSRRFFDAGGFIDDGSFLYAEEFCVGEACYRMDLPVIHDPDLRVGHNAHQTVGRMLTRPVYGFQKQGFSYALQKYNSQAPDSDRARRKPLMVPDQDDGL